jgi:integrase
MQVYESSNIGRIEVACQGLPKEAGRLLFALSNRQNSEAIASYVIACQHEVNPTVDYVMLNIRVLSYLASYSNNTIHFKDMNRENILAYLDSLRKPEVSDPMHKWIGTYNLYAVVISKFFKWLYYPEIPREKRGKPTCVQNIPQLKRKEKSIYKPSDLWSQEDDLLFLQFCPSKRDKCYHMIARDTSCRPHELLKLRIKDVVLKMAGDRQYAEILVNGKTGSRQIPLINSIPYIKDWLDDHPQSGNPNAPLICGLARSLGRRIVTKSLNMIYHIYRTEFFPRLLESPAVVPEDKKKIRELLKKPWNPYIRRHSALTEKSMLLKEHVLRQHAGWSIGSDMPQKYLHYFGNESSESLLEAYGLKQKTQEIDKMKPKQCPNCNEANKVDSKFCVKCRMVLTYDSYIESIEAGTNEQANMFEEIKQRLASLEQKFNK